MSEVSAMRQEREGSIALLVVSPRIPAGLMTRDAWKRVESADLVLGRTSEEPLVEAVTEAELPVQFAPDADMAALASQLVSAADAGTQVVWLGSANADPGLTDALADELTQHENPPQVEVLVGSWDAPGSRLLDAVAVMETLRSPGGCPWDAEQTHASLAPYLVEEAYEVLEAIGEQDSGGLQEELGDVLLQVLFHARVAAERAEDGFDIDGVAGTLVDKLIRRHPHVFGDGTASNPEEVEAEWARIKATEKPERDENDPFSGIPSGLPSLERANKMVARARKRGHQAALDRVRAGDSVGAALVDLVAQAQDLGVDPSVALSTALAELERGVR